MQSDKDKKSSREPRSAPKQEMEVVEELHGKHVLQVACGSKHTAVLVENPAFFGVPLTAVMEREKGRKVPSIVQKICAYLSNRIATEHLFRTVGRVAQVQELRKDFDRDEDVNLFRCRDPHTVTSLLKEYLRLLPEPLIPFDNVDLCTSLPLFLSFNSTNSHQSPQYRRYFHGSAVARARQVPAFVLARRSAAHPSS